MIFPLNISAVYNPKFLSRLPVIQNQRKISQVLRAPPLKHQTAVLETEGLLKEVTASVHSN